MPTSPNPPILGTIAEICLVTPSLRKTLTGLSALGIGPFQIFKFTSQTVHARTYRGQPADFALDVAFAKEGSLVVEVMQPVQGPTLMADFLEKNGGREGVQHVAFDMDALEMEDRKTLMRERGFEVAMEGEWLGKKGTCHFVFFDTEGSIGTVFETIQFSHDWEDPECEWWPHAPASSS